MDRHKNLVYYYRVLGRSSMQSMWTAENFIATMRTGRRMGKGRAILPPMPFDAFKNMSDDDLKAIFAYLQSIPVIKNKVPEPVAPEGPHGDAK